MPVFVYTIVSRSSRRPLSRRSPDRRTNVDAVGGSAMQLADATLSFGLTSEQLTRSPPEPVALIGPSETMLPPWKVIVPLVDSPDVPQSIHQLPAGTTVSPLGEQLLPDVVQRVNDPRGSGSPVPPHAATIASM